LDGTDYHPVPAPSFDDEVERFLRQKHLYAVRSVLEVFLGKASGGAEDMCSIASIEYDDGATIIDAEISIDLRTEKIESCEHCGPD